MSTWILIFSMYASPWTKYDFAALHSQEFTSQELCEKAKREFLDKFQSSRATNSVAICVQK
ncbi:hypothetical protein BV920_11135 [Pectobacterium odoriferum]|nr:hypothetical protein BV920_11135 [Pectobacterium odoriferum]